jgi:hypothetical protein
MKLSFFTFLVHTDDLLSSIIRCYGVIAEAVSNVDDVLGEMFLEEKEPTNDDIKV